MLVKEVMTQKAIFLPPTADIKEAAAKMTELDCGFIPIGENDRLIGAVTDRDIVIRALAKGKDSNNTPLREVMSERILYCYEDDDIKKVAKNMSEQQVHRLVVLDKNKRLKGIITLGDIARKTHNDKICGQAFEGIAEETHH